MIYQILAAVIQTEKPKNCGTNSSNAFNSQATPNCITNLPNVVDSHSQVTSGLQVAFGVAAGVALISLIIAAFNFATAATDAEKISRSKKAIIFSLIGLVITLSAEAIVLTVVGKL